MRRLLLIAQPESAMKNTLLIGAALALIGGASIAEAATQNYNVVTTWLEPETQPNDSIFIGSFTFDDITHTVSNLHGFLSESMTGSALQGYPNDDMTWLSLNYQLSAVYDATLGGLLVTTFLNPNTNTFSTNPAFGGTDGWAPGSSGTYYGFPTKGTGIANPGNAYAMIFVNTTNPLAPLTQAQIDKLAYADCAPGGMMGATCMTGTTIAGYGETGTMSGYPVSQTITAAVPEPETYAMMMAGLGMIGFMARRRKAT
jgi:hypothetical protein